MSKNDKIVYRLAYKETPRKSDKGVREKKYFKERRRKDFMRQNVPNVPVC
jgi:hypothetical protein